MSKKRSITLRVTDEEYAYYSRLKAELGMGNYAELFGKWRQLLNDAGYYKFKHTDNGRKKSRDDSPTTGQ